MLRREAVLVVAQRSLHEIAPVGEREPDLDAVLTLSDAHNVPDELIDDVHALLGP